MVALIQIENHTANKGKTAGRYQFDTHLTGIGLKEGVSSNPYPFVYFIRHVHNQSECNHLNLFFLNKNYNLRQQIWQSVMSLK